MNSDLLSSLHFDALNPRPLEWAVLGDRVFEGWQRVKKKHVLFGVGTDSTWPGFLITRGNVKQRVIRRESTKEGHERTVKGTIDKPRDMPEKKPALSHPILAFHAPDLQENNVLLLKLPGWRYLSQQHQDTHALGIHLHLLINPTAVHLESLRFFS